MSYETLMAIINEAGGFDNVVGLIFDNDIHISFLKPPQERKLAKEDFKNFGGTYCYVEPGVFRSKTDYEYSIPANGYHPLDHLQVVVTCKTPGDIDIMGYNDMI